MLNAFRHHGCREPAATPARAGCSRGAQRLSASRLSGVIAGVTWPHSRSCSTPFGITAVGSGDARQRRALPAVLNAFRHHGCRESAPEARSAVSYIVLNAFRHHGCREQRSGCAGGRRGSVLNAFRHHGCRESPARPSSATRAGAQRLSASRLSGVQRVGVERDARRVLNAFRHHGCRERCSFSDSPLSPCAQRLSASRLSGG